MSAAIWEMPCAEARALFSRLRDRRTIVHGLVLVPDTLRVVRVFLVAASLALAACSLLVDTSGLDDGPADSGAPDAAFDAPGVADAAGDTAGCATKHVATPFTTVPSDWRFAATSAGAAYPLVGQLDGQTALVLIPDMTSEAFARALYTLPVPLQSFDVSFRAGSHCTTTDCADGLAFAWVATTDTIPSGGTGGSLGLPPLTRGFAVAIDLHPNTVTADPATPALEILTLDASQTPGTYDWVVGASPVIAALDTDLGVVSVTLHRGVVTVGYDGNTVATATVGAVDEGSVLFTAATGNTYAGLGVAQFVGDFSACDP